MYIVALFVLCTHGSCLDPYRSIEASEYVLCMRNEDGDWVETSVLLLKRIFSSIYIACFEPFEKCKPFLIPPYSYQFVEFSKQNIWARKKRSRQIMGRRHHHGCIIQALCCRHRFFFRRIMFTSNAQIVHRDRNKWSSSTTTPRSPHVYFLILYSLARPLLNLYIARRVVPLLLQHLSSGKEEVSFIILKCMGSTKMGTW